MRTTLDLLQIHCTEVLAIPTEDYNVWILYYMNSILNRESNELQLGSNPSFELKRVCPFSKQAKFTSSLTRLDSTTSLVLPFQAAIKSNLRRALVNHVRRSGHRERRPSSNHMGVFCTIWNLRFASQLGEIFA
jgi:hypothetical protein